jgi:hypothetical protein
MTVTIDNNPHDPPENVLAWYWMSFADSSLPENHQFLGVLIIQAPSLEMAVTLSHMLELNPGGQIAILEIPDHLIYRIPDNDRYRLLNREEAERL